MHNQIIGEQIWEMGTLSSSHPLECKDYLHMLKLVKNWKCKFASWNWNTEIKGLKVH